MVSLHCKNAFAQKRSTALNILLAVRTIMWQEKVDIVVFDYNGASWRRKSGQQQHEETLNNTPPGPELSVFVDTRLGVWFVVLCCCRDPGDCLSPVLVWSLPLLLSKDFWSGMGSDGVRGDREPKEVG